MAGNARSVVNQSLWLQLEATPGVAQTDAMKRVRGLKGTPGWNVDRSDFRSSGSKAIDGSTLNSSTGAISIDTIQDFNAATWGLCGGFGKPTNAAIANTTKSFTWDWTLDPDAPDPKATFTAIYGDATQALQLLQCAFQGFGISIQRGQLSFTTAMVAAAPTTGATAPTTGVVDVPSVPISALAWNLYADDTWAAIGTTQLLAVYEGGVSFGDKYVMDQVVNANVPSFSEYLETEEPDMSGNLRVGFDAVAVGLVNSFTGDAVKFFRFEAIGPLIEMSTDATPVAINHTLQVDICARIKNPGEAGKAPNSPAITLPFDLQIVADPTTRNVAAAHAVNTVAAL